MSKSKSQVMSLDDASTRLVEEVALLLLSGGGEARAVRYCREKHELSLTDARGIVGEARRKITLAADYDRDEQLGVAVQRANEIYRRSVLDGEMRTALAAQKEINRLMDLYREGGSEPGQSGDPARSKQWVAVAKGELELDQRAGRLIDIAQAKQSLERLAMILRSSLRQLEPWPEAMEIIREAVELFEAQVGKL